MHISLHLQLLEHLGGPPGVFELYSRGTVDHQVEVRATAFLRRTPSQLKMLISTRRCFLVVAVGLQLCLSVNFVQQAEEGVQSICCHRPVAGVLSVLSHSVV